MTRAHAFSTRLSPPRSFVGLSAESNQVFRLVSEKKKKKKDSLAPWAHHCVQTLYPWLYPRPHPYQKVEQGSRKCGSTGAALLGNGRRRPNWGNNANWEKKKKEGNKERKKGTKGKWGKKRKENEEEEGKKRKDDKDKIFLKIIE